MTSSLSEIPYIIKCPTCVESSIDSCYELKKHTNVTHIIITECPSVLCAQNFISKIIFQNSIKDLKNLFSITAQVLGFFMFEHAVPPRANEFFSHDRLLLSYQSIENKQRMVIYCINETAEGYSKLIFKDKFSKELISFVRIFLNETLKNGHSSKLN